MYRNVTQNIQIDVQPEFVPERSNLEESYYFFAYHITILNLGEEPVRLVSRRWIITDGKGRVHEVNGPGVVGEQPILQAGGEYKYTSFCPLPTPTGNMRGSYQMLIGDGDGSGSAFDARIPLFFLRTDATAVTH